MAQHQMFVIHGQAPLHGAIDVDGNKNAALPLVASSILFPHEVTFHRIPQILDVENLERAYQQMAQDEAREAEALE